MEVEDVIKKCSGMILRDSIGAVARSMVDQSLIVPLERPINSGDNVVMMLTSKDKEGRIWATAYTSDAEFLREFPQGHIRGTIKFAALLDIMTRDQNFAGLILNRASEWAYPIFREFFAEVDAAIR